MGWLSEADTDGSRIEQPRSIHQGNNAAGVYCSSIGLEAANQLAKVERHGGMFKSMAEVVVVERQITGARMMKLMAAETTAVINMQNRYGGFSPSQRVVGRQPRHGGEQGDDANFHDLDTLEERVDPTTEFGERMRIRHIAKKAYVQIDSGRRVAKARLRKAATRSGKYRVGDLITYQRDQRSDGSAETKNYMRWSPASRIIGFEGRGDQKKVCWVLCEGIPVCLAVKRIRPANNDQLLAYHYLHEHCDLLPKEKQLSYVKLQRSEKPTIVKRKRDRSDDTDSDMPELESSEAE